MRFHHSNSNPNGAAAQSVSPFSQSGTPAHGTVMPTLGEGLLCAAKPLWKYLTRPEVYSHGFQWSAGSCVGIILSPSFPISPILFPSPLPLSVFLLGPEDNI